MYQTIFFDLDGTLTESAPGITRSVAYALKKWGVEVEDLRTLEPFVGPPLAESFARYFGFTPEQCSDGIRYYREYYVNKGLFENSVYPGIEDMLRELKNAGKRLIVATSKPEEMAVRILEHFEIADYFEVIGGDRREVGRDNKAKVIDYVLETMQAKKDDVIMIGDRKFDIEGAHAIGIPCIAVEYGYGDRDEFEAHGADYIAKTTEDVEKLF